VKNGVQIKYPHDSDLPRPNIQKYSPRQTVMLYFNTHTTETETMDYEPSESPESNSTAKISPPSLLPPPIIIQSANNFDQLCIKIKEIINTEDNVYVKAL